ncbi:MAG: PH domain-containing protein [Saprospiraceae bacterium]|nr:PH domain-containing protein [Saprospiraceae bacterium]
MTIDPSIEANPEVRVWYRLNTYLRYLLFIDNHKTMEFTNEVQEVSQLPHIEGVTFTHLNQRYRTVLKTESLIFSLVIWIGCVILFYFSPDLRTFPFNAMVIFLVIAITGMITWMGFYAWNYKGYAVRQHDILFKTGIFFRSTLIVAFNRVQHAEIQQGPIDRWFGLSSVTLYTAGGSSSDLTIPGLSPEDAAAIKNHIMKKMSSDEEE